MWIKVLVGLILIAIIEFIIFGSKLISISHEDEPQEIHTNLKYIHYYTNHWGGDWSGLFGYGREPFAKCKYNNCYLSQKNTSKISFSNYSAAIIHGRDSCGPEAAKGIREFRAKLRGPIIFFLRESPLYDCNFDFNLYDGIFNWTMDYHPNADVPIIYGNTYRVQGKQPIPNIQSILQQKNKLAFWITSHQGSLGKRDEYVEMLKKYITVDKYGLFGPTNCPDSPKAMRIDCKKHFAPYYKFYFAFENSLCQDYVTEKFFQALRLPLVPVVYGKVNYTSMAPPHSFINVKDFRSPKMLAEYLLYLDKNETAYAEYFKWKLDGHYKISGFPHEVQKTLCNLCDKLNNLEQRPAYTKDQMNNYWRGTKENPVCSTPNVLIPGLKY